MLASLLIVSAYLAWRPVVRRARYLRGRHKRVVGLLAGLAASTVLAALLVAGILWQQRLLQVAEEDRWAKHAACFRLLDGWDAFVEQRQAEGRHVRFDMIQEGAAEREACDKLVGARIPASQRGSLWQHQTATLAPWLFTDRLQGKGFRAIRAL